MSERLRRPSTLSLLGVGTCALLVAVAAILMTRRSGSQTSTLPRLVEAEPSDSSGESSGIEGLHTRIDTIRSEGLDALLGLRCEDSLGMPLESARVIVNATPLGATDSDGLLSADLLPAGPAGKTVVIDVTHAGHLPFRGYLALPLAGQTIRLMRTFGLTIRVWDDSAKRLTNAHCQVWKRNTELLLAEGSTDDGGQLELLGIVPQQCALLVTAPGLVAHWSKFELGPERKTLDVHLHRGRELEVRVKDSFGIPVAGANVGGRLERLSSDDAPIPPTYADTRPNGVAILDGLPDEACTLEITVRGEAIASQLVNVRLPAKDPLEPVEIEVRVTAMLHVTCRQPNGEGVAAIVKVVDVGTSPQVYRLLPSKVPIGVEGGELEGLPAGVPLGVYALVDGGQAGILLIDPLAPGEQRSVQLETLALSATRLRMIDGTGAPVAGSFRARAVDQPIPLLFPESWPRGERAGSWFSSLECGTDGAALMRLPPGTFNIQARGPDRVVAEERRVTTPTAGEEVFLVNIQPSLVGRLSDGQGRPLANWGIEAHGARGARQETVTGPAGRFTLEGPSGNQLTVSGVHPCGLRVKLFDAEFERWPADGHLSVELHRVRVSVLDLRSGTPVPCRLSVRDRGVRDPVDPILGFFAPASDASHGVTLQLPTGEWNFRPRELRPGPAVLNPGGEYVARSQRHEVAGDRDIVLYATHYVEGRFSSAWPAVTGTLSLSWAASVGGRKLEGTLSYPPTAFSWNSLPVGEVRLDIVRGPPLWSGVRTVEVDGRGAIPF